MPLPGITQVALALRCWAQREDRRRLDEAKLEQRGQGSKRRRNSDESDGQEPETREGRHVVNEIEIETVVLEERAGSSEGHGNRRRRKMTDLNLGSVEPNADETCKGDNSPTREGREQSILEYDGETSAVSTSQSFPLNVGTCEELRDAQFDPEGTNDLYLRKLRHLCLVSASAYASSIEHLTSEFLPTLDPTTILASKWTAEKFSPAYFAYYDVALDAIVVAIRGTKDIPDMITNLSVDTLPFSPNYCLEEPVGYGHAGVIRSARKLHDILVPILTTAVGPKYNRPSSISESFHDKKLILTGHSLGGAVASVLSLILSSRVFPNTECIVFGAPPCLSTNSYSSTRITMIMYGLDLVPRLSVGSLERLLTKVLQYDWRRHAGANAEAWIRSFTSAGGNDNDSSRGASGSNGSGRTTATNSNNSESMLVGMVGGAVRNYGVDGVVWALEGVRNVATRSLSVDAAPATRTVSAGAWGAARAATAFVAGLVASQLRAPEVPQPGLFRHNPRRRSTGYGRAYGVDDDVVEEALGQGSRQRVKELTVLGKILHFKRDVLNLEVSMKETSSIRLKDVEASLTMIYDHEPERIIEAIAELLGEAPVQESPSTANDDIATPAP